MLQMDVDFVFAHVREKAVGLGQMVWEDLPNSDLVKKLSKRLDYYDHFAPGDLALCRQNGAKDTSPSEIETFSQVIHHPRGHVPVITNPLQMG